MSNIDCDSIPDHKLCGYLCTVVTVQPPHDHHAVPRNTRMCTAANGTETYFVSENDVVLLPINSTQKENSESSRSASSRKKSSRIGSLNVVRQLHMLVMHRCLSVDARVIGVSLRQCDDGEEVRIVVLVDVYLPIALWSGWQFPKSGSAAVALLKHLSTVACFRSAFECNLSGFNA
ncbi:hypothetical protein M9H77_02245 [Catharanthus roseus]|uniref:Uncharacterized protein n=1 Tax=Catharanthus roseus TaxID=4058 RepID=A0ACC0C888_CATRO|nr:hypothetical protein M9H77_02245 [Catharanthus roseus]